MLKGILSYGVVEGVSKGLNKLTFLLLPLLLLVDEVGKIGLIVAMELILPLILFLGLERAVLRFYSDTKDKNIFRSTIFIVNTCVHVLLLFVIMIVYLISPSNSFFGLEYFPDLFLIVILVYLQGNNLIALNMYRVDSMHKQYFKFRLIFQILKILLVIVGIYFTGSFYAYLFGAILSNLILIWFNRKMIYSTSARKEFNKSTLLSLLAFSWPFIFHGVAGNLLGNADKFILEQYLSLTEVGQYTFIYAIASSMSFAYIGISVYIEPLIYKQENELKRNLLLNKFLMYSLSTGLLALIILSLIGEFLLAYIYEDQYIEVSYLIPLLASGFLALPFYLKSNYTLIYRKHSLSIATISIITSVLNIVLNIVLIPYYGILAAVWVTIFSYLIQACIFTIVSLRSVIKIDFFYFVFLSVFILLYAFQLINLHLFGLAVLVLIFMIHISLKKGKLINEI
ncbi:oligosaccharide flippase family protein [Nonlabens sp.]|uniref:oligosaccharide flippase family protein n=1 Tax=Nonlabens sp. TaxID=1888209 RepID=UPI0032653284